MATTKNILIFIVLFINLITMYGQELPPACSGSREGYAVMGTEGSVFNWAVEGGEIVANWNDSIIVEWDKNSKGKRKIEVVEITPWNCVGDPYTVYVDVNSPDLSLNSQYPICEGDSILIYPNFQYYTPLTFEWSNGSDEVYYITSKEGRIWLKVTGTDGCSSYDSTEIVVNPNPVVDLGKDTMLCGNDYIELDAGFHYSYIWSSGENFSPIRAYPPQEHSDSVWVKVTNEFGCSATDTVVLLVCTSETVLGDIPNTITPNNDGQNDVWVIEKLKDYPGAIVEIYDRWGRLIYNVKGPDPMNVWDGRSAAGKQMPMDSYYYVIDLNFPGMKPTTGIINIIK